MKPAEVEELLASVGESSIGPPVQVTGGLSGTQVWRVELDKGPHVLRVFKARHDSDAMLESTVLDAGRRAELPVARIAARNNTGRWSFLLLDWLDGRELGAVLLDQADRAGDYGGQIGWLQARMHEIEAPRSLPPATDWPTPGAYPAALRSLLENLPAASDRLLHLDYHPWNVLVEDGAISGLIDWTNARRGDPRFDLARTYLMLRMMPGFDAAEKALYRPILKPFLLGWHRSYRTEMGRIEELAPYLAWAGYGMLYDMGRKHEDSLSESSWRELRQTFRRLERCIGSWMARAGL